MASTDAGHNHNNPLNQNMSVSGFGSDMETSKAALKFQNYAAGMAAAGLYWPSAAAGFDTAATGMYGSMAAAAYSQASVLAAAAASSMNSSIGVTNTNSNFTGSNKSNSSASPPSSRSPILSPSGVTASTTSSLLNVASASLIPFSGFQQVHSTTPATPKKKAQPVPDTLKDETYWERRKRNNESARRSRESRRMKEEQIAMRTVYLEQENLQLRTEVSMLRSEIEKLRVILYQHH